MKKLLSKIWTELTRERSIEFVSYETEAEENARLKKELADKKLEIMTDNYKKLMNERLIPYCRDLELSETGLLLTNEQLFEKAHAMFIQAKKDGRVDALNNIVGVQNV